jgi:hypothetical protein
MNKKGLSYVDWAISFGLFIVYLLTIFILIKPEVINSYDEDFLNSIIKQGLEEDVYIDITTYPIFLDAEETGDYVSLTLPDAFSFLNNTNMVLLDNLSNKLNFTINGELKFDYNFNPGRCDFKIIYSNESSRTNSIGNGNILTSANYSIGIAEHSKGIDLVRFDQLQEFDELKIKWGYPMSNDFAIEIYNKSDLTIDPIKNYNYTIPLPDSKVNVLKWSDWKINNNSQKELITILIKTW